MNTHDSHLSERAIEALAGGREDLASDTERAHARGCSACSDKLTAARELAASTRSLLARTAPDPSSAELDAWVAQALAATAAVSGEVKAVTRASRRTPARLQLAAAAVALLFVGAGVLTRELPTLGGGLRLARETGIAAFTLADVLLKLVPGGRASVLVVGAALMFVFALLIKHIASDSTGDLLRAARRMLNAGLFTLTSFAVVWVPSSAVYALDFQGDWDAAERPVTLTVERAPASEVLRQAAAAAGVSLIATLPDDPQVTLAVTDLPLREVIAAVLEGLPVVAKLNGKVLVIRSAPAAAAQAAPALPAPPAQLQPVLPPPPKRDVDDDDGDKRERKRNKARDRITMGEDVVIVQGQRVKDLVTMGGDADIGGEVLGDVVTMGGAVIVRSTAAIRGDLVTLGGEVTVEDGATVEGERVGFIGATDARHWKRSFQSDKDRDWGPSWLGGLLASIAHYALLFLLGMLLLSFVPERMTALERTVVRAPGRALALGSLGFLAAVVTIIVLAITIIGIPAALVVAVALPVAVYLGLAAIAGTLGAAIPVEPIQRSPIAQLACGVGILFLFSLIPFLGKIGLIVAATVGLGAVLLTRFSKQAFGEPA